MLQVPLSPEDHAALLEEAEEVEEVVEVEEVEEVVEVEEVEEEVEEVEEVVEVEEVEEVVEVEGRDCLPHRHRCYHCLKLTEEAQRSQWLWLLVQWSRLPNFQVANLSRHLWQSEQELQQSEPFLSLES